MYNVVDFKPFRTQFLGFDNFFDEVDKMMRQGFEEMPSWPPYDIYTKKVVNGSIEEKHTFIRLAVAGIKKENLSVHFDATSHILEIKCAKNKEEENDVEYIRKGIASRTFQISKTISPDLELVKATTSDEPGCLIVEFREKPKKEKTSDFIEIE